MGLRTAKNLRAVLVAALVVGAGTLLGPATAAHAAGVFTVYVSPNGADGNDGRTPATAVATLDGAQVVLTAAKPTSDVEVRIAKGTYVAKTASARWKFFVAGHSVSFMPAAYRPGRPTPMGQRPVFHGPDTPAWWMQVNLPDGSPGGDTNLRFLDLVVEHYTAGGMTIAGPTTTNEYGIAVPASAGLNHNLVSGMIFRDGGSVHVPSHYGWGALDFVNSSDNLIVGNQFVRLENAGADAGLMHGVYLAHYSSRNIVSGNLFDGITDDPMRVRNDSDDNQVFGNVFKRGGSLGYFTDWFCDTTCVAQNPGHTRECASHGNTFHHNELISGYAGAPIPAIGFFVGDNNYPGEEGCDNDGQLRIHEWGNHGPGIAPGPGTPPASTE